MVDERNDHCLVRVFGKRPFDWVIAGLADLNGDGKADVVWSNTTSSTLAVWLMNGLTITSVGFPGSASMEFEIAGMGDVDGNGMADVVWRNHFTNEVVVWLMNGATIASSGVVGGLNIHFEMFIEQVADTNGDGKADLIIVDKSFREDEEKENLLIEVTVWLLNGATVIGSGSAGLVSADWEIQN